MTTQTLGLTLGGGAAFGAAHVGVLQVLEERGIRPGDRRRNQFWRTGRRGLRRRLRAGRDRARRSRLPLARDRPVVVRPTLGPARHACHRRRRAARLRHRSAHRGLPPPLRSRRHRPPDPSDRDDRPRTTERGTAVDDRRPRPAPARAPRRRAAGGWRHDRQRSRRCHSRTRSITGDRRAAAREVGERAHDAHGHPHQPTSGTTRRSSSSSPRWRAWRSGRCPMRSRLIAEGRRAATVALDAAELRGHPVDAQAGIGPTAD